MKRHIVIVVVLLLVMTAVPGFALGQEQGQVMKKEISLLTAEKIAKKFYKETGFAIGNAIRYSSTLYDVDDSVLGYYFNIWNNEKTAGYIVVSATKERSPILQYGDQAMGYDFQEKSEAGLKPYYLNALNIIHAKDTQDLRDQFQQIKANKRKEISKLMNRSTNEEQKKMLIEEYEAVSKQELVSLPKGDYQDKWQAIENKGEVSILSTPQKVLSVSRVWQRTSGVTWEDSACGPTTGVMIANYLKSAGYTVRGSSYYGGNSDFINHLWSEMAWWWGTSAMSFRENMEQHLNLDYSNHKFEAFGWDDPSFSNIQSYLDDNIPYGIKFESNSNDSVYASYHWVAAIGYKVSSLGDFVAIKDPDGGQNNTGTHFISYDTNEPYAYHVFIYQ
ncbi:hypothetical protein PAECIP111893_04210 [Paenibacillus plantiphilus]|uniref:Spi protease inhibitor domain-containing protein n=1 Tax=Paenibacillus plantiphilus TaxID=2905650 RepID=A0ABN8GSE2_9BACL|nr:Spi family protease inhibitor [Paenibacillus plantiphilus]CAH1216941.1 hypothetical protein PAECIP111893_04210 [Paenibacillus plantiphilus]